MQRRLSRSVLLAGLLLWAGSVCPVQGETVPGPLGILRLPAVYESHRATFRAGVSQTTETVVADLPGEGCLRHFWLTLSGIRARPVAGLEVILRIYVDGQERPNVEMPLTPFFGIHHGHEVKPINAPFIQVTDRAGFNSYFPMPYQKGLRITLQKEGSRGIGVWFQTDYHRYTPGSLTEPLRFHALYRRVNPAQAYGKPYHLGHGVGRGVIVGMTMGMRTLDRSDRWYHCGGDLVLLDGRTERAHLLSGIGGEDYFGTAWGQDVFANRSIGSPYYDAVAKPADGEPEFFFAAYRFFDRDPIAFADSFWYDFGSLANDISSVLYWYQSGPVMPAVRLPAVADRLPDARVPDGRYDLPLAGGRRWQLCGPFSCEDRSAFDRREFPEDRIDAAEKAPADFGQKFEW